MNTLTALTTLDILIIVSTIVIGIIGFYLMIILHRFAHMSRVADRFAKTVERFQDAFSIIEKIPTDIVRRVTDHLPSNKK
mgnify:CR=1 FL=1